jgi:hypothetical protein
MTPGSRNVCRAGSPQEVSAILGDRAGGREPGEPGEPCSEVTRICAPRRPLTDPKVNLPRRSTTVEVDHEKAPSVPSRADRPKNRGAGHLERLPLRSLRRSPSRGRSGILLSNAYDDRRHGGRHGKE